MWIHLLVVLGLILLYRWYRQSLILDNLIDKYVFITGCDTGFGNILAKNLDRRGIRVLAACLTDKGAENLKEETSSRLQTVILDVTDSESVSSAAKWVSSIVGEQGLWGLVNNAGVSVPGSTTEWMTKADFAKVLDINLLGLVDVTLNLLPFIRRAQGRVVNIASVAGRFTACPGGYCMSKYGVESFSDSLRREMKPFGVKVCIIEPGFFNTRITNAEVLKADVKRTWESATEEVRKCYGEQYYLTSLKILEAMKPICNTKLHLVPEAIEHALSAVHPWTRYSVGWDAKLIFLPLSYFPTFILDFLLTISQPKPAQAK
ncbi:PREDICTED: retinol dehydrogenase 7-like [Nanorana parkeri]|uniref:retinol dehydrogenase 7-like n=1 Tax=Nanorana parkeri TaxID=125878 RepID=UPI000854ED0C|nr:PREDICTED: retinol dehydrogenase 7-like [Nanorana parkeri]